MSALASPYWGAQVGTGGTASAEPRARRPRPSCLLEPHCTACNQQMWEAAAQKGVDPAQKWLPGSLPQTQLPPRSPEAAGPRGSWFLPASRLLLSPLGGIPSQTQRWGLWAWLHPFLFLALCSPGAPACSVIYLSYTGEGSHNFIPSFNLSFGLQTPTSNCLFDNFTPKSKRQPRVSPHPPRPSLSNRNCC